MLPSIFGENLFDEFFGNDFQRDLVNAHRALYGKHGQNMMTTDVRESDSGYEISIDLPGFKKEDIKADLNNGYLTISAAKGMNKEEKDGKRIIRQERYTGSCSRSFYVGDLQPEEIRCKYEDGVLTLDVPKADARKTEAARHIAIE